MDPYLGDIKMFGFSRIPKGWLPCDGRVMSISQNQALYALIGTTYGGDGVTTFNLPDLRGRTMMGRGNARGQNFQRGVAGGTETVTLTQNQIPVHTHNWEAESTNATSFINNVGSLEILAKPNFAVTPPVTPNLYTNSTTNLVPLNSATVGIAGAGGAHENRGPYLTINICICTSGYWPPRP